MNDAVERIMRAISSKYELKEDQLEIVRQRVREQVDQLRQSKQRVK